MFAILFKLVEWFAKGGVAAFFIQAGLTVVAFAGLDILITEGLDYAVSALNGLPSAALQLALLSGISEFFAIVGGALLTRIALVTAMNGLSLKKT